MINTRNITLGIAAAAGLAAAAAGMAQADPGKTRDALMGANWTALSPLVQMAKGETDYDPRVAELSFNYMHTISLVFGDYFPEGSQNTNGKFYASPKVWEDRAGFDAELAKFAELTKAAADAKPADKAAFLEVFGPIGKECSNCHEKYRVKAE